MSEKSEAAKREEEILSWWKENGIFAKSLEKGDEGKTFVFYEGPPTANGRPGVHHMESRSFKDAIPRYKTMQGYRVPRRAGWDTHGLPVELEVEKQLGFSGKPEIEKYGIAEFNKKCRESVFNYISEWEKFTDRIGYWVDQSQAYFTFDASYMESLFSIVKKISDDGRLYKDYKVLPWCPVCGTALSSHELAQGYEEVKDLSLTVKFALTDEPNTYMLAWTTTPWTLPGNIALAVGEEITYSYVQSDGEIYIVATALLAKVFAGKEYTSIKEVSGANLVGKKYQPLYTFAKELATEGEREKFNKAFQVYAADFVTTEDGTGIVHTAVMYGTDDFELGQQIGLPKVHLVDPEGKFVAGTDFLAGASVIDSETNIAILKDLQQKGNFFAKESYTHSYPHCWRSKNRLIYYARDSWFIRMTELRDKLLAANSTVNWEPSHIRDGRMGEWLANVKDWAISRERYWGTPLPVWQSEDGSERVVIGSIDELTSRMKTNGNTFFGMRHGEAENNAIDILDATNEKHWPLTEKGREQVRASVAELKEQNITKIIASPFERTQETARIAAEALGLPQSAISTDERLHELNFGNLNGEPYAKFIEQKAHLSCVEPIGGGESYNDARLRFAEFLYETEKENQNEHILVISHGIGLESFSAIAEGRAFTGLLCNIPKTLPAYAEIRPLSFKPLPHNDSYELDLHRPYIDDVVLIGDSGKELRRVKEVMDVWFDSGAMPFAEDHYPFENKEWLDTNGFPADYISEAIDQTRGWFYTLQAVSVLMGRDTAYKNVICLGHLLDEKGKKMSKSKGNVIEPFDAIDMYGADTLRLWMYSVNQPGDNKNFDPKTVKESARVISWFENSVKFYQLFAAGNNDAEAGPEQVIDTWMRTRLSQTILEATKAFDAYDLFTASRCIAKLIEDLSQWYVRRIRDRARDGDQTAITTLRDTIQGIATLLAPLAPFTSEWAYQIVRTEDDAESVHLADWLEAGTVDEEMIGHMRTTRELASEALMLRQKSGIKVSQPLALLSIPSEIPDAYRALIAEEVNVKEVRIEGETITLDTEITPELQREGDERTFARAIAEARKVKGFSQSDTVRVEEREDGEHVAELSTGAKHFSLVLESNAS